MVIPPRLPILPEGWAVGWEALPRQAIALSCPADIIGFGGAVGGAKTDWAIIYTLIYGSGPNQGGLLIRKSYPELRDVIVRMHELYPKLIPGAKYHKSDKIWTFPTGGSIELGYIQRDADVFNYQGRAKTVLTWEELNHYTEWAFRYLSFSRMRAANSGADVIEDETPIKVIGTFNPGGIGHAWTKAYFVKAAPPMTPIIDVETGLTRVFIPSKLRDNKYLAGRWQQKDGIKIYVPSNYERRLNALPPKERKALLDGDFDAYEGEIFQLTTGIHKWSWDQLIDREPEVADRAKRGYSGIQLIPPDWPRYQLLDWGYAKPYAIEWIAVGPTRAYGYDEIYGIEQDDQGNDKPNHGIKEVPKVVAGKIKARELTHFQTNLEAEPSIIRYAGPDIKGKRGEHGQSKSHAEVFAEEGLYFDYWPQHEGTRVQGVGQIHNRLHYLEDPNGEIMEWPGFVMIDGQQPHLDRCLVALPRDPHRPEDWLKDPSVEDHAPDALKGFCLKHPYGPDRYEPPKQDWQAAYEEKYEGGDSPWI